MNYMIIILGVFTHFLVRKILFTYFIHKSDKKCFKMFLRCTEICKILTHFK